MTDIEKLSVMAVGDVPILFNLPASTQLQAHAYAQLAPHVCADNQIRHGEVEWTEIGSIHADGEQ